MFDAIWRWFDAHAWPVRYRLHAEEVIAFLRERGVAQLLRAALRASSRGSPRCSTATWPSWRRRTGTW
jgi:hypothetical protein